MRFLDGFRLDGKVAVVTGASSGLGVICALAEAGAEVALGARREDKLATTVAQVDWMAQAAGRVMQPGSSSVNINSILGLTTMGLPQAAYAASKAGLIGLIRDLAQQWSLRKGSRVNAVAPGYFESEMTDQFGDEYVEQVVIPRTVLGRLGKHEEIGAALLFLATDEGGYVTGLTLPVEGGVLAT